MASRRRVLSVVGTRPNMMKIAPIAAELARRGEEFEHVLVHTGQHYDRELSEIFLEELGIGEPDFALGVGSGSHAQQTAGVMERLEPVLLETEPDVVLVPGDVNSTLAAALTAAKLQLPIGHVEAGLRSFDRTMPEEINRIVADQVSQFLFIHSPEARDNLLAEGCPAESIHDVGNTMIDSLVALRERIDAAGAPEARGLVRGEYLVVTLHRPSLVDGPLLADAVAQLEVVSEALEVIFPVHPRTRASLEALGVDLRAAAADRARRLRRVPEPRRRLGRSADRLGRDPGGDDVPRAALLHAARQHGAADHGLDGHEHAARARPGAHRRRAGAAGRGA